MIWQILKQVSIDVRKSLYTSRIVCGCVYRSFDDFQAHVFFRFLFNGYTLEKKDVSSQFTSEGLQKLDSTLKKFSQFNICEHLHGGKLHVNFAQGVQKYIKDSSVKQEEAPSMVDEESCQKQSFSLLGLLFYNESDSEEVSEILKSCNLTKIHYNDTRPFSKQNFKFICSNVAIKIGILIKGFLRYRKNKETIQAIIQLNFLNPKKFYRISQQKRELINQLAQLKLVRKTLNNQYFCISDALQHFAFEEKKQSDVNSEINCTLNIQTNFKVYAKIKSSSSDRKDFYNLKGIMRKLIQLEFDDFDIEELIIGKITERKAKQVFREGIKSGDYFNFFKQYIDAGASLEKDLGSWGKLKFLGLQGPGDESVIPNNVRQEIRLWESENFDTAF